MTPKYKGAPYIYLDLDQARSRWLIKNSEVVAIVPFT